MAANFSLKSFLGGSYKGSNAPANPAADLNRVFDQYANSFVQAEAEYERLILEQADLDKRYEMGIRSMEVSKDSISAAQKEISVNEATTNNLKSGTVAQETICSKLVDEVRGKHATVKELEKALHTERQLFLEKSQELLKQLTDARQASARQASAACVTPVA